MPKRRRSAIEHYQCDLALPDIAELWRRGSVIGSWILDLTARALAEQPDLRRMLSGRVSDSGEGRWTAAAAIESATPAPVLTTALFQQFSSRGEDDFPNRLLSAMRYQFSGHHGRWRINNRWKHPTRVSAVWRDG